MTPKEKAKDLVYTMGLQFDYKNDYVLNTAKQCALIAVRELIQEEYSHFDSAMFESGVKGYWQKVKEELEKL